MLHLKTKRYLPTFPGRILPLFSESVSLHFATPQHMSVFYVTVVCSKHNETQISTSSIYQLCFVPSVLWTNKYFKEY
jgi:hypothetical protein